MEWITIAAIFLGPVFALSAQRGLDRIREKKERRVRLYLTLMRTRMMPVAPEHVNALNTIAIIFNGRRDQKVRAFWQKILDHVVKPGADQPPWQEQYADLKADMLREIGLRVGYDFSTDYLKRQAYYPILYGNIEADTLLLRTALTKVVTADGLRVQLVQPTGNSAPMVAAPILTDLPKIAKS